MRRNARVVGNLNPRTKADGEACPRGLSIEELVWWLLCQVEMSLNTKRTLMQVGREGFYFKEEKGCPGQTIKFWLASDSSKKHSDEDMKDVMGALTYAA